MKSINRNINNPTTQSGITKDEGGEDHSEFPGYPLYAPEEDIMNQAQRVDVDLNIDSLDSIDVINSDLKIGSTEIDDSDRLIDQTSNLTKDDLEALGPKDLSLDMGEDEELLKHRVYPVDFTGKDIDLPSLDSNDKNDGVTNEDEENSIYSIGGDRHDDLEEDKS